jgi:hypothetical protein
MTRRRVGYACLTAAVVALSALVTGLAAADDKAKPGKDDPQAMMAAYEKAGEPAEQHKHVLKMVGKWNVAFKTWMDPRQPPMESTGTAEGKALLGDRFVQVTVTSTFMGKPFSGVGINGYDRARKKFVGTWIDSMSTGMMRAEGTTDAAGKVLTSQMTGTDPLTGKESRIRIVGRWESDDQMVEEFFEKKAGREMKTMEITYTRTR